MLVADLTWFRYKSDPEITAMTDLVDAYQRREVHTAEKIIKGERRAPVLSGRADDR